MDFWNNLDLSRRSVRCKQSVQHPAFRGPSQSITLNWRPILASPEKVRAMRPAHTADQVDIEDCLHACMRPAHTADQVDIEDCLHALTRASFIHSFILSFFLSFLDRLVGLVVKASASRAEGPGFESRLRRDFFGVESYQ